MKATVFFTKKLTPRFYSCLLGFPYADFTLQVAPGVPDNRPQSGSQPVKESTLSKNGHTLFNSQTWYEGLERESNTSINPYFYGTYLAETKPRKKWQ